MMAWYGFVYFSDGRRNGRVNVLAYEQGLIKLLAVIRKELAGQPFSARYPGYGAVEGSLAQGPEL